MSSKAPKSPAAPDPNAVAAAQTGSNVSTAIANSWLGNANVNSPLGSVTNKQQSRRVVDPKTGKAKNVAISRTVVDPSSGKSYQVPVFQQDIKLSPAQQKLFDQQNEMGAAMNDTAMSQIQRLSQHLSANPNLTGDLPGLRDGPQNVNSNGLPELRGLNADGLPELADNMDAYRGQVESGLMERMNPQLTRDRDALENKLITQGMTRGSAAFDEAMNESNRGANDARTQIFLASGNEARAMQGEQRANRGQLFGERQAIGSSDLAQRGQLFNERVTTNNDTRANLESDMARRNQMLQERLTERNQPINEITSLMSGGQVSMPQFQGYNAGQVEGTPVGQYTYQSNAIQQQQAQQQAAANGQMWDSAGKIGAGLFSWSDSRLKKDIQFVHADPRGFGWYTFRYRGLMDDGQIHYGVMAQEVQDVLPDAVHFDGTAGYFYVDYGAL